MQAVFFAAALNYVLPNASCNVYYFLLIKQNGTNKSVVVYIHQGMAVFHTWVEQVLTKVPGLGQALESKVLQYTICVDLNIKRQIFYIVASLQTMAQTLSFYQKRLHYFPLPMPIFLCPPFFTLEQWKTSRGQHCTRNKAAHMTLKRCQGLIKITLFREPHKKWIIGLQ